MVIRNVLLEEGRAGLAVRRVRLRDRIRARLKSMALDRQLADGATPEASVALALHAAHVYQPAQRRILARSLTRIVDASASPPSRAATPLSRMAVVRARAELVAVVDRLNADGPVGVQGVARVRLLLADGCGPLYGNSRPDQLQRELRSALVALDSAA
jgi:hypothetical protein